MGAALDGVAVPFLLQARAVLLWNVAAIAYEGY